jgi:hypothetical protein
MCEQLWTDFVVKLVLLFDRGNWTFSVLFTCIFWAAQGSPCSMEWSSEHLEFGKMVCPKHNKLQMYINNQFAARVHNIFVIFYRPPDEVPKQIYENIPLKEPKLSANSHNIGPPPSFAPPPPPPPRKTWHILQLPLYEDYTDWVPCSSVVTFYRLAEGASVFLCSQGHGAVRNTRA